jgi:hypothetical protein
MVETPVKWPTLTDLFLGLGLGLFALMLVSQVLG